MINLRNKTILVVEDDELNFIYIDHILKLTQCKVAWVKTGIDAIEYARSFPKPDMILMDIQLPDMKGEKAAAEIRVPDPDMPIIAQTASQISCQKETFIEAGCSDLLIKPFGVNELLEVIGKFLNDQR